MKNKNITVLVVLAILVFFLVGVGAWYLASNKKAETPEKENMTATSTEDGMASSTISTTTAQSEGISPCCEGPYWNGEVVMRDGERWYRNEAYGFEFRVPEGMEPGDFNAQLGSIGFYADYTKFTPNGYFLFSSGIDKTGESFSEHATDYPGKRKNPPLNLGNFTWHSFDYYRFESKMKPYPNHGENTIFFMRVNKHLYTLRVRYGIDTKQEVERKLEKAYLILSTFHLFPPDSGMRGPKTED